MGLIRWVAILTCGHTVGDSTVTAPYEGEPWRCPAGDECHSTTVAGVVTDLAERDSHGKL